MTYNLIESGSIKLIYISHCDQKRDQFLISLKNGVVDFRPIFKEIKMTEVVKLENAKEEDRICPDCDEVIISEFLQLNVSTILAIYALGGEPALEAYLNSILDIKNEKIL